MGSERDAAWDFINSAPTLANQETLDDLFARTLKPFGVDKFDCGWVKPGDTTQREYIADRGLAPWRKHYTEQGYAHIDPSAEVTADFKGGFTWSDVRSRTPDGVARRMWGEADDAGMGEGLIVPLSPRRLTQPVVRLTTPEARFDPGVIPLLQSISIVYASSLMSLSPSVIESTALKESPPGLTVREIECLHWSARGKTNAEIGVIVSISRHTVNTHIESAKRKLGVATRVQAIALAHELGLLSIV